MNCGPFVAAGARKRWPPLRVSIVDLCNERTDLERIVDISGPSSRTFCVNGGSFSLVCALCPPTGCLLSLVEHSLPSSLLLRVFVISELDRASLCTFYLLICFSCAKGGSGTCSVILVVREVIGIAEVENKSNGIFLWLSKSIHIFE